MPKKKQPPSANEQPPKVTNDLVSLYLASLITFASAVDYSSSLPLLWPRLEAMGATEKFYGMVLSVFSASRFISVLLLGILSDRHGARRVLLVCFVLFSCASLLDVTASTKWHLLASRSLGGLGAGQNAVTLAYVTKATSTAGRTNAMATLLLGQFSASIVGPAATALAGNWSQVMNAGGFQFAFTAASALNLPLQLLTLLILFARFRDVSHESAPATAGEKKDATANQENRMMATVAAIVMFLVFFVISSHEAVFLPVLKSSYQWKQQQISMALAGCGMLAS